MQNQPEPHEIGLVNIYLGEVRALASKALDGANVESDCRAVVDKAAKHFAVVVGTTEIANLRAFAGQLALNAGLTHPSQPAYREALAYANEQVNQRIREIEAGQPK